jgi:hypothetical protein
MGREIMAKSNIVIGVEADTDALVKKLQAISKHTEALATELLSIDQQDPTSQLHLKQEGDGEVRGYTDCQEEPLYKVVDSRE